MNRDVRKDRVLLRYFVFLVMAVGLFGCTGSRQPGAGQPDLAVSAGSGARDAPGQDGAGVAPRARARRSSPAPPPTPSQPRFKELSPLDVGRISISFVDAGYREVFQSLARSAGLNLVLDTRLEALVGRRLLTAEYQEMRIRPILDAICHILDVVWREEYGTLFIEPWQQELIHLDFLASVRQSSFGVGGDVLGGAAGQTGQTGGTVNIVSPLTGRFEIKGETTDTVTDIYANIEAAVEERLGSGGDFLLNRQTGTLMIRGRPSQVAAIKKYLADLRRRYSRQVLIEARIIEVSLGKGHQFGIDWRQLALHASTQPLQEAGLKVFNLDGDVRGDDSFYTFRFDGEYFTVGGIFKALQQFGSLKVLSNPRIKAMNGQAAMISVGQSVSYLRSLTQTSQGTGDNRSTDLSTEIGAVFDGILLGVTPIIREDDSVTLHIVPIKSDLVELNQQQLSDDKALMLTFPKVNLREISTVVNARNGDLLVLGGLIMERKKEGEEGLPWLGSIPGLGVLFKQRVTEEQRVEMIIILQVTVQDA